jgi:hypothetical protein
MQPRTATGLRNGVAAALIATAVGVAAALIAPHDATQLYRNIVSVITNSLVIGYVVGVFGPAFGRLTQDVGRLEPLLPAETRQAALEAIDDPTPRATWAARLVGLVYGIIPNVGLIDRLIDGQPEAWTYAWVVLLVPALWAVVFPALWRLYRVTRLLYRLGRRTIDVDLDDLRPLDVFAELGVRHLLLIVIGLAFIPFQAILLGGLEWRDFVLAGLATVPMGLAALLLPVVGVHRNVVATKGAELDRLTAQMRETERHGDRYLLLALRRGQIAAVPEWPFTLGTAARIVFYVIIPPCAWIAAAVVDNWVGSALS